MKIFTLGFILFLHCLSGYCALSPFDIPDPPPTQLSPAAREMLEQQRQQVNNHINQIENQRRQQEYRSNPYNFKPTLGVYPNSDYVFINGSIVRTNKRPEELYSAVANGSHRQITGMMLPDGYTPVTPEQLEMKVEQMKNRN
jgi:hypothetical protein